MSRILKDYPEISLKPEDFNGKVDFFRIFGRLGPIHIEVGSGKGTFLLHQAKAQPNDNFLGIEWARRYYRYAVDRIGRWDLTNVRIIRTDAAGFIAESLPDDSVDCFHVYFPDPWPKKRHHKRRFICSVNLEHLLRCLKTEGQIRIATDHVNYFEQIEEVIASRNDILKIVDFIRPAGAEVGEWAGTNFERKYIKDQRAIYTLAVEKI